MSQEATELVITWIVNDNGKYFSASDGAYATAQRFAREEGLEMLEALIVGILNNARLHTAAWHTRDRLSNYELRNEIDWHQVSDALLIE